MSTLTNNSSTLQNILDTINALPEASNGVELPALTNEGTASDLLSGKELINSAGEKITGTIETKTSSDLTASGATVTVPAGYYASSASKSVATATQATPSISVNSSGLIIATSTQSEGYVSEGTKGASKQLTTQSATTITPTKSSQAAVASGVYTTGAVTVAAIPDEYVDTSSATASESDVMSGKTYGANGSVKTGTFTIDSELTTQDDLLTQLENALEGKAAGGNSGESNIETCTVDVIHYPLYDTAYAVSYVAYQTLDANGNIVIHELSDSSGAIDYSTNNFSLTNVVCPSIICIIALDTNSVVTGGSLLTYYLGQYAIRIDEDATLEFQPAV